MKIIFTYNIWFSTGFEWGGSYRHPILDTQFLFDFVCLSRVGQIHGIHGWIRGHIKKAYMYSIKFENFKSLAWNLYGVDINTLNGRIDFSC